MFLKPISHRAWVVALLLAIALPGFAAKKTSVAPGHYQQWGPDIDVIDIVKTFSLPSYSKLVVVPLDVSAVAEKGDKDLAEKVDSVLAAATFAGKGHADLPRKGHGHGSRLAQ